MNTLDSLHEGESRIQAQLGFTLIELVITMVIVAILAAIAIPSYTAYIQKSRRTDAKSALLGMASLEERYFSTNNTYTNDAGNLGYPTGTVPPSFAVGSGYYNITTLTANAAVPPTSSTSVGSPATYTITATAIGTQAKDTACLTFTINSAGQQTATPDPSSNCWQ